MSHDAREEPAATIAAKRREVHSWEGVSVAAVRYERDLVPALFEPWAGVLVDLAGVRPGDRVLDLACGTGVVARAAARRVMPDGHVCGLDVNENMLAIARRARADIEWLHPDRRGAPAPPVRRPRPNRVHRGHLRPQRRHRIGAARRGCGLR